MNDLISRQAAVDALAFEVEFLNRVLDDMDVVVQYREKCLWGRELIEAVVSDILDMPSADWPTGEWRSDEKGYFYCSKCKKYPDYQVVTTDYCPNCGVKMEVEK